MDGRRTGGSQLRARARREPVAGQPNWHQRRYYRIVPGREDLTDEWTNPQKIWKLKRYGYYKHKSSRT
jgi:hypothetical protein